jgi:hypothetical protein
MKKKKHRRPSTYVTQPHHITYEPPRVALIFKGEHYSITKMLRRKRVSQGFLEVLASFIETHRAQAEDLNKSLGPFLENRRDR